MGDDVPQRSVDVDELRSLVEQQSKTIEEHQSLITKLLRQIEVLKNGQFGPSSEKRPVDWTDVIEGMTELLPFPELQALERDVEQAKQADEEQRKRKRSKSAKRGPRSEFPDHLAHVTEDLPVPVEQRYCACGRERPSMGFDESKRLERITTSYVVVTRREKLAPCRSCCERSPITAPGPAQIIEGGLLGASMLAWTISQRFGYHMPYYRLEQQLRGEGLELSRSVLSSSAVRCGELLAPVVRVIEQYVLSRDLVQVDDTGVVVRNGPLPGRGYWQIWAYRALDGPVFFRFTERRCSDELRKVLGNFRGFVQADACSVYDFLFRQSDDRTEVGCWAHMRRGIDKAGETEPELASEALNLIRAVYEIERIGKRQKLTDDELHALRQKRSRSLVEGLHGWCELTRGKVLPKGPLGKAIQYVFNHWSALTVFLDDPRIREIDNNGCEAARRAVAVGRKNWLFVGDVEVGPWNVNLMTLVNTCKALGVDPEHYLTDVLLRLDETPASRVGSLAPMHWRNDSAAQKRVVNRRAARMHALGRALAHREGTELDA